MKIRIHKLVEEHIFFFCGLALVLLWSTPMLLTKNNILFGDFTYFAQVYEAIKLSVLEYNQFPWWNPWVGGGVPLYGNPQAGVFSITTLLSFFFMPSFALKLTLTLFYVFGYSSFYVLARHLKVSKMLSTLLGLAWILNGFFVAHLPSHFTFIWLLVLPWFVLCALRASSLRWAIILGLSMAAMVHGQMHYSFIIISLTVGIVLLLKFVFAKKQERVGLVKGVGVVALITLLLAGHRLLISLGSKGEFKNVTDPATSLDNSVLSFLIPHSHIHGFVKAIDGTMYGWSEQTAYVSIFVIAALLVSFLYIMFSKKQPAGFAIGKILLILFAGMVITFLVGVGDRGPINPYEILKSLPFLESIRVSARWFILTIFLILLFVGVIGSRKNINNFFRFLVHALCVLAVVELFLLNFTYQARLLNKPVAKPPVKTHTLTFQQHIRFGESGTSPDGHKIPFTDRQYLYREYESTLFNIGTILANEAHVDIYNNATPKCSYVAGCGYVLSKNAKVVSWSPHKVVLHRTGPGDIKLNANISSYTVINGKRAENTQAIDRFAEFIITDSAATITVEYKPKVF